MKQQTKLRQPVWGTHQLLCVEREVLNEKRLQSLRNGIRAVENQLPLLPSIKVVLAAGLGPHRPLGHGSLFPVQYNRVKRRRRDRVVMHVSENKRERGE